MYTLTQTHTHIIVYWLGTTFDVDIFLYTHTHTNTYIIVYWLGTTVDVYYTHAHTGGIGYSGDDGGYSSHVYRCILAVVSSKC